MLEDGRVVAPRGCGQVNDLRTGEKAAQKGGPDPQRTGTGYALDGGIQTIGHDVGALAQRQFDAALAKVRRTGDRGVLLVQVFGADALLGLTHARQHERLAVVVPVGADAQVDFLGVGVAFVGLGDAEDGVRGAHLHLRPP